MAGLGPPYFMKGYKMSDNDKKAAAPKTKMVKVRILSNVSGYKANDVAELDADTAKLAVDAGWADSNKEAVKYASKLPQNIKSETAD